MSTARPEFSLLRKEHCEKIHRAALEILRRTGITVHHDEALSLLKESGGVVIEGNLVRFQPGLVEWAIAQTPSRIPLCRRGGDEVLAPLEGETVNFGTGSDCRHILDPRTDERRLFTSDDLKNCARVVDALPELQFCMSMGQLSDVPKPNYYREQFALLLENTSKPIVFVCDDRADCEANVAMAAAAAGGIDKLRIHPSLLLYSEPSSPLKQSETALGKVLYMAEQQLPIVHSPAPVQGATGPVTLAGGLSMAIAEFLSGLVIHQLKRAGSPAVFGCGMHHLDMTTTACVFISPTFLLSRMAVAEMGRFYGMPTWGYAGESNSCRMDEQAASEITISVVLSLLAGSNLVHDIGYLETGLTCSPENMVFSNEVISMMRKVMDGIPMDEESMALDVIHEVGQEGEFLSTDHTYANFRKLWQPQLFSRTVGDDWVRAGSRRLGEVLKEKTISIIEEHKPEPLADSVMRWSNVSQTFLREETRRSLSKSPTPLNPLKGSSC
jgi:trimethylamine--corrinoid protein Co-methyltransferase